MLLLSSHKARKGRYKHTVFWTNHRNKVHGKVTLSVGFLFYSRLSSRPPMARVRDRDNDKQERSYEQTNDNQTAMIMKTKPKAKPHYGKQTFQGSRKRLRSKILWEEEAQRSITRGDAYGAA